MNRGLVITIKRKRINSNFSRVEFQFTLGTRPPGSHVVFIPFDSHPRRLSPLKKLVGDKVSLGTARLTINHTVDALSWEYFKPFEHVAQARLPRAELVVHEALARHLARRHPQHVIWDARLKSDFDRIEMEKIGLPVGGAFSTREYAHRLKQRLR